MNIRFARAALVMSCSVLLSACVATTQLSATTSDTAVVIAGRTPAPLPHSETLGTRSFGNYVFKATQNGAEPMYGILPLKFNGGYMAMSILFFAPSMLWNLREVYPYYEFDVASGVVHFKRKESDEWRTYTPTKGEAERAKASLN